MKGGEGVRSIYWLAGLAAVTMVGAIGYGLSQGDLVADTRHIMAVPWGFVTLIDVYLGLFLFSGWILWREQSKAQALVWVALLMTLGNVATAAYVLVTAYQSKGDVSRFWLGRAANASEH